MQLLLRQRPPVGGASARCRRAPCRRLSVSAAHATPPAFAQQQQHQEEPNRVLRASIDIILERYRARTPSYRDVVARVYCQPGGYGEGQLAHDHLAFRTLGVPGLGIEPLSAAFEAFGYERRDTYTFPGRHLLAAWLSPPEDLRDELPRVFVSQLQVERLSPRAQGVVRRYADPLAAPLSSPAAASLCAWTAALTGAVPWRPPSREDYAALLDESEYGAWVLANGYALNHTALRVHGIAGHEGGIRTFAEALGRKGFELNAEGGVIKVSEDGGLLQCSTVADVVDVVSADGEPFPAVGPYVEFAERRPLPRFAGLPERELRERHRREGFEADSAANIFASTTLAAAAARERGAL